MIYTVARLAPPAAVLGLWLWLADGTAADPANLLLLIAGGGGVLALSSVRRYWHVRKTSRSRRDSARML